MAVALASLRPQSQIATIARPLLRKSRPRAAAKVAANAVEQPMMTRRVCRSRIFLVQGWQSRRRIWRITSSYSEHQADP